MYCGCHASENHLEEEEEKEEEEEEEEEIGNVLNRHIIYAN